MAGIPTSFVATIGSGKPVIAILGEYDALPGLSQQAVPERQARPVRRRGMPAATISSGWPRPRRAWRWASRSRPGRSRGPCGFTAAPPRKGAAPRRSWCEPISSTTAMPCSTGIRGARISAGEGSSQARIAVKFRFHGTSSHAAAAPELGRSALDAIELTNHAAELLREHTPDFTRIHHVVTAGGSAPNVVPDFGEVFYYIRHPRSQVVQTLYPRLLKCAEAGALATETRLETEYLGGILEILPNADAGTGGASEPVEAQRFEV